MDGSLAVKMRDARNFEAGVNNFNTTRAEDQFLNDLANTILISREIAYLTKRRQEDSFKAIIEKTDRVGLQLRAILADSKINPTMFKSYLADRPRQLAEILQCRWLDLDDSRFTTNGLPDNRDERLASLMEQLMMDCRSEQLAYRIHRHSRGCNTLRPRLLSLPNAEAEKNRRYATSSMNAISKLIKTLRDTVNDRERPE